MEAKTPAPRALVAVKAGPPTEPIDKQLRITAKVRRAIDLMARGECKQITEAAAKADLRRADANYFAQSSATVREGQFRTERFSALGKGLPPGNYRLEITMPMARVQPAAVRAVIGEEGEFLKGRLVVKKPPLGTTLTSTITVNIGGLPSSSSDEAARRDADAAMAKWRRESCEWIERVSQKRQTVSECIDKLSR
jgi:hypothetical protein